MNSKEKVILKYESYAKIICDKLKVILKCKSCAKVMWQIEGNLAM